MSRAGLGETYKCGQRQWHGSPPIPMAYTHGVRARARTRYLYLYVRTCLSRTLLLLTAGVRRRAPKA